MIHTVKDFSVDREEVVEFFCVEFPCFFYDPTDTGNLISGTSAFSKSSLYFWSFQFTYCWSQAWRILSITLLACEMCAIVQQFEHSLTLSFRTGIKTDLFQFCETLFCLHVWVLVKTLSTLPRENLEYISLKGHRLNDKRSIYCACVNACVS